MKTRDRSRNMFVFALVSAVVLPCLGWYWMVTNVLTFPWVWEEVSRVPSTSGSTDIVTYEGNRGAMSSFRYACYLVNTGEMAHPNVAEEPGAVLVCSNSVPEPRWINDNHLELCFKGSRVFYFEPHPKGFDVLVERNCPDVEHAE